MRFAVLLAPPLTALLLVAACSDDDASTAGPSGGTSSSSSSSSSSGSSGTSSSSSSSSGATDPPDTGAPGDVAVAVNFEARVGAGPFSCASTIPNLGTTNATIEPLDFRLYVHDVRLVGAGGDVPLTLTDDAKWQSDGLALLDFEDKTGTCANGTVDTNTKLVGKAPAGTYTGIKFKLGVPFARNHADVAAAPTPLNVTALFWSWNAGYKFARIDGRTTGSGSSNVFNIHLGSTGCVGNPAGGVPVSSCGRPNVGEIALTGFDPTAKKILVDYKALVDGSDLSTDKGGAPGCMSGATDPECPNILAHLGIDPATGAPNAATQKLFRVE